MANFPITKAQLVEFFVRSILFGLHMASTGFCIQSLLSKREQEGRMNWRILILSVVLIANATLNISIQLYEIIQAFVLYAGPGGPSFQFEHVSLWINISKVLLLRTLIIQTRDAMLIYRCWVMYHGSWTVVAFSILLWLGCLASALFISITTVQTTGPQSSTALLVWQIWKKERLQDKMFDGLRPRFLMKIIIESGLLYTTIAFVTFVTDVVQTNGVYVMTAFVIQIVGISFNLIFIRTTRLAKTREITTMRSSSIGTPLQFASIIPSTSSDVVVVGVQSCS
ncbi:hypothetical protein CPB84DRAFT_1689991 [Gymnopilus junonius]|uniref:Uncharacterized protein n=1 Tax=Gymnopilus junonius TaxID=109634 RepID=A0A9P5TFJ7_GYMJU|nr:hypothetical protein CPB84DRAFT_1689991 [Gymnopilus junonius]